MKPNLRQLLTVMCVLGTLALMARDPVACKPNYYNNALNKKGQALLTALYNIVSSHTDVGYDGLWNVYDDADTNSGGYYIDLYSNYDKFTRAKKCGNYSNIGDCVNREHSFPKSWWGSGKADQYSDAYHLYPTDGYVNNQRSNYPFGECANGTRLTNGKYYGKGKLGTSTFSGYSGIVFEPDDEYKGDFARTYFYMATAYNNIFGKWHGDMLASSFPYFSDWALNLLLKWHRQDPVSDKERLRNNYVCAWQENRNPYIDHPELVEHIWGNQADKNWTGSDMSTPTITAPAQGDVLDLGTVRIGNTLTATLTVKGNALEEELEIIVTGTGFSASPTIIDVDDALAGTTVTVSFVSNTQGTFTGNLQVTSSETTAVNVALRAQAVDGIVAKPATSITSTGFTANWENTDQSTGNYNLFVTDAQGTVLEGYPVAVRASLLSKAVTGLQPLTGALYKLYKRAMEANLAIYSLHLPLDGHPMYGHNVLIAKALDMSVETSFTSYKGRPYGYVCKGMSTDELNRRLKALFPRSYRAFCYGSEQPKYIAIMSGSGGQECLEALVKSDIDTLVTGEIHYSAISFAQLYKLNLFACGHYATECFGIKALLQLLHEKTHLPCEFIEDFCEL